MSTLANRLRLASGCAAACALLLSSAGCAERRGADAPEPVYEGDIELLLQRRCARCHGAADAGAFAVGSYLEATGCVDAGRWTDPDDERAPLLRALARPDHADVVSAAERERIEDWVRGGAALRSGSVHGPGLLDPGADGWHGRLAAADRWGPIKDPDHLDACGRCHRGAPATPQGVRFGAPEATACTACHREPAGVLACGTCHGSGARAYPPRAPCLAGAEGGAHRAHVSASAIGKLALACSACHPAADARLAGSHGDGHTDVTLDPELAGEDAEFDAENGRCTVGCHARSGARARPDWYEPGPLGCGDCHASPPDDHYAGACSQCHAETNDDGSALRSAQLHMNGRVDLGSGGEACGACHGERDDPWPSTGLHALHRDTLLTEPVACGDCHVVPERVGAAGHLDAAPAEVVLSGRAAARGRTPVFQGGRCADVACHGAGLANAVAASTAPWDSQPVLACSGCHGVPPRIAHPQSENCASLVCHGGEIAIWPEGPRISEAGRRVHVNGSVDVLGTTP